MRGSDWTPAKPRSAPMPPKRRFTTPSLAHAFAACSPSGCTSPSPSLWLSPHCQRRLARWPPLGPAARCTYLILHIGQTCGVVDGEADENDVALGI
jgi:hypothetical protein